MEKMEREEMIEMLKNKANVSKEEAEEVLEKLNWDLLDSIIYLERKGKVENNETTTIINLSKENNDEKKEEKKEKVKNDGIGKLFGKLIKFLGKIIKKGNKNYFEIRKEKEEPIKISLTISAILLLFGFWFIGVLLLIGLFLGYKYSIVGPNFSDIKVNDILEKASESAENIKNDFKEGYNN